MLSVTHSGKAYLSCHGLTPAPLPHVAMHMQLAAVLVVDEPGLRAALQSELPAICLLAKLDPAKVRGTVCGGEG